MGVRVLDVIAVLIMDRRDISSDPLAQLLGQGPHQGLTLGRGRFYWQGDHEPLADAPPAFPSLVLCVAGCLYP